MYDETVGFAYSHFDFRIVGQFNLIPDVYGKRYIRLTFFGLALCGAFTILNFSCPHATMKATLPWI